MADEYSIQALTLNLLAEEQMTERSEARDPVKAAVAILIILLTLTVGLGSLLAVRVSRQRAELAILQRQCDVLLAAPTTGAAAQLKTTRAFCEDIVAINGDRYLIAPQLALLKELTPATIQLTRIAVSIATELKELPRPPAAAVKGDKPLRPPPVQTIERLSFQLDGRAQCSRPEIEVEKFIQSVREQPALKDKIRRIQLRSITPAVVAAQGGVPTATFVIECEYKELK